MEVVNFYATQIPCVQEENKIMVGIKSICESLGLDFYNQSDNIKSDEILKDEWGEHPIHDSIGREQNTLFLPLQFVHGWLFQIKFTNTMSDETKKALILFKRECYNVLFNHFYKRMRKQLETNKLEIELLKSLNQLIDKKDSITDEIKGTKKLLDKIRDERLNEEPTLF